MTSAEFSEWIEFNKDSPIDDSRADLNAGIIASTIANYAGKIRNGDPLTPSDFMPFYESPEEASPEEPDVVQFFTGQAMLFDMKGKPS